MNKDKVVFARFKSDEVELLEKIAKHKNIKVSQLIRLALEPYLMKARIEANGRIEAITNVSIINEMLSSLAQIRFEIENREIELKSSKAKVNDRTLELFKKKTVRDSRKKINS